MASSLLGKSISSGDTPDGPIMGTLDRLIGQVPTEVPVRMAAWARDIQAAAGKTSSMANTLPRLELLFDRLPPAVVMPAAELHDRFRRALCGIIRASLPPPSIPWSCSSTTYNGPTARRWTS